VIGPAPRWWPILRPILVTITCSTVVAFAAALMAFCFLHRT
jgi:hypothetical protein